MTVDEVVALCMAKPGAEETYPWGDAELVVKVGGKAFAFIGLSAAAVGLKCGANAEEASEWRARYPGNRVSIGGAIPDDDLLELLDISYDAIVAKLPKSRRP
jgi:predicted DNA-binding protein (MmcQ/YjbR family)